MDFGAQVDETQAKLEETFWLLTVFNVPDRLTGLTARYSFRQSRKNPRNWWRAFRSGERDLADEIRAHLLLAKLKGRWQRIDRMPGTPDPGRKYHARKGLIDFSRHNVSQGWRRKAARRK